MVSIRCVPVQMKGNVATRMGTNELMITELVFRGVLTEMQPAEIAALLSGLVFQAKSKEDPKTVLVEVCVSLSFIR